MDTSNSHRVLVAEDEISLAQALATTVRSRFGCHVDVVYNGDDALAALTESEYDLLITDMMMPGCHGLDLVGRVHSQWPQVSILVSTAFPHEFPYVQIIEEGASDFIVKPYSTGELEAKLIILFRSRGISRSPVPQEEEVRLGGPPVFTNAHYKSVFEFNTNGMLILEPAEYRIADANRTFCSFSGRERGVLVGESFLGLFEPGSRERLQQAFVLFAEITQGALSDVWLRMPDGQSVCLDLSVSFIEVGDGRFVQVSCKDVTEQHNLQERLAQYAQTDALTGLLNQRMLHTHIESAVAQARAIEEPATLLFIDLDNFKECNDSYGHPTGDLLLKDVGELIRKHTRNNTDEGFRYGGDEFAVLLSRADAKIGAVVGERIRRDFTKQNTYGTTMSIGVAEYRNDMDAAGFVKAADAALYTAKLAGKNQISVA